MAPASAIPAAPSAALVGDDLYELRQCERIVKFRDAIFAGSHPRIKIPSHLVGKLTVVGGGIVPSSSQSSKETETAGQHKVENSQSFSLNQQRALPLSSVTATASAPLTTAPTTITTTTTTNTTTIPKAPSSFEFEPVLTKQKQSSSSNGEILLKRQTLEEVLEAQSQQQLAAPRQDGHCDLDIADIFERATELAKIYQSLPSVTVTTASSYGGGGGVSGTTASTSSGVVAPGVDGKAAVDALPSRPVAAMGNYADGAGQGASPMDDDTFYSSQDESSFEVSRHGVASSPTATMATRNGLDNTAKAMAPQPSSPAVRVPGLTVASKNMATGNSNDTDSGGAMTGRLGGNGLYNGHLTPTKPQHRLQGSARDAGSLNSPHTTSYNSPSLSGADTRSGPSSGSGIMTAVPAQVVSLRNELPAAMSSPDSSPRASGLLDRKKGKKKGKRKADRPEADGSAYIKSEPESPPLSSLPLQRPNKRQKHTDRSEAVDSRSEHHRSARAHHAHALPPQQPPQHPHQEQYSTRDDRGYMPPPTVRAVGQPLGENGHDGYPREYASDPYGYRPYPPPPQTQTHHHLYPPPVAPPPPANGYPGTAPPPQYPPDGYHHHPDTRHYPEQHFDPNRTTVRPSGGTRSPILVYEAQPSPSSMHLPHQPPPRIVRDSLGREYLEHAAPDPSAPLPGRHPAHHPPPYPSDPGVVYDRGPTPQGQITRRPGYAEPYRGEVVAPYSQGVYAPQNHGAPTYLVPRRVAAPPEQFPPADGRPYGSRDYSVRPVGDEYADQQRFVTAEGHYSMPRSASVRPPEPGQYDVGMYGNVGGSGGAYVREYRSSVTAEPVHHGAPTYPPPGREYSVRPPSEARPPVLRETSARPVDNYYGEQQQHNYDGREGAAFRRPGLGGHR